VTGQHRGNGGGLDRRGFGVAGCLDGFENAVVETERTKWHSLGTIGQYSDYDTRSFPNMDVATRQDL